MTLTPRELASKGPMALKDTNSVEYAWQLTDKLKRLWQTKELTLQQWQQAMDEAERHRIYERVPPESPYGNIDALIEAEIGVSADEATKRIQLGKHGGNRKSEQYQGNNCNLEAATIERGNSADYLTARLERDAESDPDKASIFKRLQHGEYRSVRAAAIDAGYVTPKRQYVIPTDPAGAARALIRKFNADELQQLIEIIAEQIATS